MKIKRRNTSSRTAVGEPLPRLAPATKVDTIVVSDIHLGSHVSRVQKLTELIERDYRDGERYLFERIILLGDIFDTLDLAGLSKEHWDFLALMQKLSRPESGVKVVWMEGNHDKALEKTTKELFNGPVLEEYEWNYGGKHFLAVHGDIFDKFIIKNPRISNASSAIYRKIQKIDSKKQSVSRFIKRWSKKIYLPKTFANDVLAHARKKSAAIIFCGHTHHADVAVSPDGIAYYNSGCWTDIPSTYITVGKEGVRIHEVW